MLLCYGGCKEESLRLETILSSIQYGLFLPMCLSQNHSEDSLLLTVLHTLDAPQRTNAQMLLKVTPTAGKWKNDPKLIL